MKIVKIIIVFIVLVVLGIGAFLQLKIETYIKQQNKIYNILDTRKRLSYKPVLFYFIHRDQLSSKAFLLPYVNRGLEEFSSKRIYDEYIVYCFFSKEEKLRYLNSIPMK